MSSWTTDKPSPGGAVSVVFRLPKSKRDELADLAKRTRIRQSEHLREAIADMLTKHKEKLR